MKNLLTNHLKNLSGWKSTKKYLVFVVDDYGNVRLNSAASRTVLLENDLKLVRRFDLLDALDTRQDYEGLFDVLTSVKDAKGKSAIFSPYAMTLNVDFDATLERGAYVGEDLKSTYTKLSATQPEAYSGAFELMKQGIRENLLRPQFHGTEHLNERLFNQLLKEGNPEILINLKERSLAGLPTNKDFPNLKFTHTYGYIDNLDLDAHKSNIQNGLKSFENTYGFKSLTFNPPAQRLHPSLFDYVANLGVIGMDKPRDYVRQIDGKSIKEKNTTGVDKSGNYVNFVRNCVFEPNDRNIDWVNYTFDQIKASFFWKRPAIISSHRVNFAGHIDPENRKKGLDMLKKLLKKVVTTYPDVEFIAIDDLCQEILKSKK